MNRLTKEQFLQSVAEHEMTVVMDTDSGHRHLTFSKPKDSNQHFHINTWGEYLSFTGDMGSYVFSRNSDMFRFFRSDELAIQPSYWSEKCQAACQIGKIKKFDPVALQKSIDNRIKSLCLELEEDYENHGEDYDSLGSFTAAVKEEMVEHFQCSELDEYRFISAIEGFESSIVPDLKLIFDGDYEWINAESYTYHYQWCLYAIVWAIKQYDDYKNGLESAA